MLPANFNFTVVYLHVILDQADLKISDELLVIHPGNNRTCFEIEAIDDTIIEDTEFVNVTVMPMNPDDRVMDGTVSITIMDNDSK